MQRNDPAQMLDKIKEKLMRFQRSEVMEQAQVSRKFDQLEKAR